MTVASTESRKEYALNGVTTSFATNPVVFFDAADWTLYVVNDTTGAVTNLTLNTHYSVTGGSGSTGSIDLSGGSSPYGAGAAGYTLVMVRSLAITQSADFVNNDSSDAEVAEDAIDRLTMISQELDARVDRSFHLPDSDTSGASVELPAPEANTILGWDSTGLMLQNYVAGDIAPDILVTPFMETVLDDVDAATARATLDAQEDVVTTKGDLVVGGAVGAAARKAAGTNGKALIADSSQADGLLWAALACQPGGRLTLTTAAPVTAGDVSGAATVYYTPYKHNIIQLYDGSGWIARTFTELSQTTVDATKSPAAVANNSNYDVFVWNDAGTLRATRGPAWTSDTARGVGAGTTELEFFEGRYVNKNAITNGPAARKGLYVGTIRSDGAAQINDSLAKRHVWNTYNRVQRAMRVIETTNTWVYSTATFRQANAAGANQLDFVRGLDEDVLLAKVLAHASASALNGSATPGIGIDSTVINSAHLFEHGYASVNGGYMGAMLAFYEGCPGIGRHTAVWLEKGDGATTTTWVGDNGGTNAQTGIAGRMPA